MLGGTAGDQQDARYRAAIKPAFSRQFFAARDSQRGDRFLSRGEATLYDAGGAQDVIRIGAGGGRHFLVVHDTGGQVSAERPEEGHGFSETQANTRGRGSHEWLSM